MPVRDRCGSGGLFVKVGSEGWRLAQTICKTHSEVKTMDGSAQS